MNHHQLLARNCLILARLALVLGLTLIAGALLTGPSWLSMVLAVLGVQALNISATEYADRKRHLGRSRPWTR